MSAADKPTLRHELLVAVAAIAGIAAGFFLLPPSTTATDYLPVVVTPACFGVFSVIAIPQGGKVARWMPRFLVAMFLLNIASRPHVAVLSALGIGAGAIGVVAALRRHQRLAVVSSTVCSALLAATLAGGLFLR